MSKEVNRSSAKLYSYRRKNTNNNISKNDNVSVKQAKVDSTCSWVDADSETCLENSHKRLSKLKQAIGSGRFEINSTRVAEKFIQFETQLSI